MNTFRTKGNRIGQFLDLEDDIYINNMSIKCDRKLILMSY